MDHTVRKWRGNITGIGPVIPTILIFKIELVKIVNPACLYVILIHVVRIINGWARPQSFMKAKSRRYLL